MGCIINSSKHESSSVFPIVVSNNNCSWSKNRHNVTVSCLTILLMVFRMKQNLQDKVTGGWYIQSPPSIYPYVDQGFL